MPENLPVAENIKKLEAKRQKGLPGMKPQLLPPPEEVL